MYKYEELKHKLFTDEGQRKFLTFRDRIHRILNLSGGFTMLNGMACADVSDSWLQMAHVDRLVELGEIKEIPRPGCAGQSRIFVAGRKV